MRRHRHFSRLHRAIRGARPAAPARDYRLGARVCQIGRRLVGVAQTEQRRLREGAPHQLESGGQAALGKATGHHQCGTAEIVGGAGAPAQARDHGRHALAAANIRLLPGRDREGNARRMQRVDTGERRIDEFPQQPGARGEGLDIFHRGHVKAGLVAVAHLGLVVVGSACDPGLVDRSRLAREDHVGQVVDLRNVRHRDFDDRGAGGAEDVEAPLHQGAHLVGGDVVEVVRGHADGEAVCTFRQCRLVVGHGAVAGGRVTRVMPGDHARDPRRIAHGSGERPHSVQCVGERHETVAADEAVGCLEPDHTAAGRGQAHGTAGIGAERAEDHASGDRGARAARRAARDMGLVPRVAAVAPMLVVAGGAGGEFRHVEPAEINRAGLMKAGESGAVVVRYEVLADARAAGGDVARTVEHVLVGERHAVQRTRRLAPCERGIGCRGTFQRRLRLQGNEAVEDRLEPLSAGDSGGHHLDGGELPRSNRVGELDQAHQVDIVAHVSAPRSHPWRSGCGRARIRRSARPPLRPPPAPSARPLRRGPQSALRSEDGGLPPRFGRR